MEGTMHQLQYSKYHGGSSALQHVDVPIPSPRAGELLIKVEAASVNPVDWRIQDGLAKYILPRKFPYVPGSDITGEVVSLGPQVTGFKPGDKVISYLNVLKGGSLAEYAVSAASTTVIRAPGISAEQGACLPVAGFSAIQSVRNLAGIQLDGSSQGLNVLITAASGGVGIYAVQGFLEDIWKARIIGSIKLAKLGGTHLTVTCGARNVELLKSLGADEVLDYKTTEGERYESPSGKKYDVVINCAHYVPLAKFKPQLKPIAKVIDMTPIITSVAASLYNRFTFAKQKFVCFYLSTNGPDLQTLADLLKEGKLRGIVDSTFPLRQAGQAWDRSSGRHATGKVLVTM